MSRTYFFVGGADPRFLEGVKGCKYVEDAGRGHGPELWSGDARMPQDYPARVALVTALPGARCWQIVPLVEDGGALLKLVQDGAAKAGLTVYSDAKALEVANPTVASAQLYPQVNGQKRVGSVLQVKAVLAGDDAAACATAPVVDAKIDRSADAIKIGG
jgi:hypothetical protein